MACVQQHWINGYCFNFGEGEQNALVTSRLYAEWFPDRYESNHVIFTAVV